MKTFDPKKNKNIVICCDGTGNKFGIHNTNIVKISQLSIHDDSESAAVKQITYYDPGVGTLQLRTEGCYKKIKSFFALVFGIGLNQNIIDAYTYLMENYLPGDKIFLFGFSRGAYTVRALAGMLFRVGLLRKGSNNLILYASEMYHGFRTNKKTNAKIAQEFKETFSQECKPFFIGVFDTVSALAHFNREKVFYDASLNPEVMFGYHALAIDEKRSSFKPFLWDESKKISGQSIEQVWFSGDHSNIGGGHPRSELSDISLKWMLTKANAQGLLLKDDWKMKLSPNPSGQIYDLYNWLWGISGFYLYGKFFRSIREIYNNALIHISVKQRMLANNQYRPNLPDNHEFVSED